MDTSFRTLTSPPIHVLGAALLLLACSCSSQSANSKTADGRSHLPNAEAARTLFQTRCGVCHILTDADTTGESGPNLDATKPLQKKVEQKIKFGGPAMPKELVSGADETTIVKYVVLATSKS